MKPRVSVVIPTYNRPHFLAKLLESLVAQKDVSGLYEVIVVSDGSTDGTHELLSGFCDKHPVFRYVVQENQGPAAARNFGLEHATGEIVAYTDDDCLADPGWVQEIIRMFDERPGIVGMEGQTVTIEDQFTPFTHQVQGSGECYASCNVAYLRETLAQIGGFDRSFFYGNEDVDVAWRMMCLGEVIYNERMVIIHPPIPLSFMKFVRIPETYGVEILLYQRHPAKYKKVKKHNPLHVIFISLGLRYLPREIARSGRLAAGSPLLRGKTIAGLLFKRIWLLLQAPRLLAMYFGIIRENKTYVWQRDTTE